VKEAMSDHENIAQKIKNISARSI